jgi:hypothetical protein
MENAFAPVSDPVTAVIVRRVKPDRTLDFEAWASGMIPVARQFDGFLGTNVIRPRDSAHPEYVMVARFDTVDHLKTFMASREREEYLQKSEDMTEGEMSVQELHGFESFFTLPGTPVASAPPARYKMAILTILGLYPPLLLISTLIAAVFHGLPRPLLVLFSLLVLVPLMTYAVMPWITRLFQFWLYPKNAAR